MRNVFAQYKQTSNQFYYFVYFNNILLNRKQFSVGLY